MVMTKERTEGAALDGHFDTLGALAKAVVGRDENLSEAARKALNEGTGAGGGFLVPTDLRSGLEAVVLNRAIVRPRALVVPMTGGMLGVPTLSPSSSASNFYGGVTTHWGSGEAEDLSANVSKAALSQTVLYPKKLYGYAQMSEELVDDAPASDAFLRAAYGGALAYAEDEAFLVGTGAGQPLGILEAPATVKVAKESGQGAATLIWENVRKMVARLLPASFDRAIWVMSPSVRDELLGMTVAVGTGGAPAPLNLASPTPSLVWRPIFISDALPVIGTVGDLMLCDFSYYLIGDRQQMTIEGSRHASFTTFQVDYRITERLDGRPWISNALTPRNGSDTVSPFVVLATRA